MPQQTHHNEPSNIQPVPLRRVRVEELDEVQVEELLNVYWDERADEMSEHDSGGVA